jgi:C4-type Zn-finger protein
MAWTKGQCESVFEDFWRAGQSQCPIDGAVFSLQLSPFLDGDYMVTGVCRRCGEGIQMNRSQDPQRHTFRQWTDAERASLVDNHFAHRSSRCPVCESRLNAQEAPYFGGTIVAVRCVRCGNLHEQDFPHK